MSQIIKQPNGKYCIFSGIIDNITHYNLSREEIIEVKLEQAREEIIHNVDRILSKIEKNEKPYHQFTMSFDDMVEQIKIVHGEKQSIEISNLINERD